MGSHGNTRIDGVRTLVPDVFEDYARIFHPALVGGSSSSALSREVRWQAIAQANGKVAHPAMQWSAITSCDAVHSSESQPGLWDCAPKSDSLPWSLTQVLCEILAEFTRTPEKCWCAVWEGYSYMVGLRSDAELPRLPMWNRPMIVAVGPLNNVPEKPFTDGFGETSAINEDDPCSGTGYRSPSLWWPDDRSWCVATDVEMTETYIGASSACIDRLIEDNRLEALRVTASQDITQRSDTINCDSPARPSAS